MKKLVITVIIALIQTLAFSQTENWDTYIAQWDKGPGSVTLNMALINTSPKPNMPFLVVTGATYKACREDGLPKKEAFEDMYKISDAVNLLISNITTSELAGTFTFQCERLDYIYVKDTTQIRTKLTTLYSTTFKNYKYYLNIETDREWKAYREFLYPNEETQEYMSNQKIIDHLINAGDNLTKPRQVDHWLYFKSANDRQLFVNQIKKENYKVEGMEIVKDDKFPYQLHISRRDLVDMESISSITTKLKKAAELNNGNYDGWETFVVK